MIQEKPYLDYIAVILKDRLLKHLRIMSRKIILLLESLSIESTHFYFGISIKIKNLKARFLEEN